MRTRRGGILLTGLLAASATSAEPPALESVSIEAHVESDQTVSVEARYLLATSGRAEVDLTSLALDGSRAVNVRAFVDEREVSFRTSDTGGGRSDATVELPPPSSRHRLRLTYEVLDAGEAEVTSLTIPLWVARWPPREALPDTFTASVSLPGSWSLQSAFPRGFESFNPIDLTTDRAHYRFELPVMPAFLRLEVARGAAPLWTLDRTVDGLTVVVLLTIALLGWRRLREALA